MKSLLKKGFEEMNIPWDEDIYKKLVIYKELLLEWNNKFNLTAITDETEIMVKHFLDSLSIWDGVKNRRSLADVGSGAGFPGIPLKIIGFSGETVLMDSLNKRVGFLTAVIKELDLKNCRGEHIRAEDAGRGSFREKFDAVTARAVANLPVLCEYCLPLVKKGGVFIAMKGPEAEEEVKKSLSAINKLGGSLERVEKFQLSGTDNSRILVYIEKIGRTPDIYPRKAGTPKKRPL